MKVIKYLIRIGDFTIKHLSEIIVGIIVLGSLVFLINLMVSTEMPFGLPINDNNDWISFWGDILGGMVTFLALKFTIEHEKKENTKDRHVQVKPYFNYSINNNEEDIDNNYINIREEGVNDYFIKENLKEYEFKNVTSIKCNGKSIDNNGQYIDESALKLDINDKIEKAPIDVLHEMYRRKKIYSKHNIIISVKNIGLGVGINFNIKEIEFGNDKYIYNEECKVFGNMKVYGCIVDIIEKDSTCNFKINIENLTENKDKEIKITWCYNDILNKTYKDTVTVNYNYEESNGGYKPYIYAEDVKRNIKDDKLI